MFILIPSCPADMQRAGAEASVVSVSVLVLVVGVGRHLELCPDVDRRAARAPLWRNLQGSSAGVGAALDPYAAGCGMAAP